ncbi:hypothetical protein DM02DRAFT_64074 [Periconia macrospinosa]|uniref:Uncharacterized protein n=1 Tax=Periconia macrospinosa TaxID=97972 RepID=A0A2V1DIA5_9PLEO|nr:hypothetical protein DM02DRAFT_64074 [Periconia macrospinosa]
MCNGHSTRVSQGGSIAVLRPTLQKADSETEIRVLFSNSPPTSVDQIGTQVQFHGLDPSDTLSSNEHRLVIHRDGNLETSNTQSLSSIDPFFSFTLGDRHDSVVNLSRRLELGVGEKGIIGRRISMLAGSRKGERVVAEGIIGWN